MCVLLVFHLSLTSCLSSSESSSQALTVFNKSGLLDVVVQCLERHPQNMELAISAGRSKGSGARQTLWPVCRMVAENCHPCINVAFTVTGTPHGSELLLLLHPSPCGFSFCDKSKCLRYNDLSYSGYQYVPMNTYSEQSKLQDAGCIWCNWFPAFRIFRYDCCKLFL